MPQDFELGKWISSKWGTQVKFADKLGVTQGRVSRWLKGQDGISADYQTAIRKLGYTGPWPAEEAQDAAAGGPAPYVTREEFAEERGALRAEIRLLREALEKMGEAIRALDIRTEGSAPRERRG
jgi:transcriptional regulator with XRE-family HTH domain